MGWEGSDLEGIQTEYSTLVSCEWGLLFGDFETFAVLTVYKEEICSGEHEIGIFFETK